MPERDILLEAHEERIRNSESFAIEVAGQMAAMAEQLKQVGEKVVEVGETLKESIDSFRKDNGVDHDSLKREVESLKTTTEEHGKSLALLLGDRDAREKRVKLARKAGVATILAVLGGIATRWGESIYNWFVLGHRG